MKKKKENIFGVKIGDIFCYHLEFICFFQVIALRGSTQVVVKEIENEIIEEIDDCETKIIPIKDKFKKESWLLKKDHNVRNSNEGDIKTVSLNYNNIPQLTGLHCANAFCKLWDGKPMISLCWSALYR